MAGNIINGFNTAIGSKKLRKRRSAWPRSADSSGWSGLFDAGFVLQNVTYTRDENGLMRPPVTSDNNPLFGAPLPIPQFAFAKKLPRPWGGPTCAAAGLDQSRATATAARAIEPRL